MRSAFSVQRSAFAFRRSAFYNFQRIRPLLLIGALCPQ